MINPELVKGTAVENSTRIYCGAELLAESRKGCQADIMFIAKLQECYNIGWWLI
jgi:hypothetical protein